jgi:hypothetical protein
VVEMGKTRVSCKSPSSFSLIPGQKKNG